MPVPPTSPIQSATRLFPGAPGCTISCLLCGRHVARSTLRSFRLAGRLQYRCRAGCQTHQD